MGIIIDKYTVSGNEAQGEVLPNLLDLTTAKEIAESEFVGFIFAQQQAIKTLSDSTIFDLTYLYNLHKDALSHLYIFAGKLRTVNMLKGDFAFPPASFLVQIMNSFQIEYLKSLKDSFDNENLIINLARLHAELLYIHPFREGNGRTIRLFTNMIYLSKTGKELNFVILEDKLKDYILAVQQAGQKEYKLMEALFLEMRSGF